MNSNKVKIAVAICMLFLCIGCDSNAQMKSWEQKSKKAKEYNKKGNFEQAIILQKDALNIAENIFGKNHIIVGTSSRDLAVFYNSKGDFDKAIPLYERSLLIFEKNKDSLKASIILNNIGLAYTDQYNYDKAELYYKRSIEKLGKNTTELQLAVSLGNLAWNYTYKYNLNKAELLFKRSLEIHESANFPNQKNVAFGLRNLGLLYMRKRDLTKAEPCFKRSLKIFEEIEPPNHHDIADSLTNLATIYYNKKLYSKAEPLYKSAVHMIAVDKIKMESKNYHSSIAISLQHHRFATAMQKLAILYIKKGMLKEAEPLFLRALQLSKKIFGPNHPQVAYALKLVSELYKEMNRNKESLIFKEKADEMMSLFIKRRY